MKNLLYIIVPLYFDFMQTGSSEFLYLSSAATICAIPSSLLYIWGFWSTFDINPLEYIALSDVVAQCIVLIFIALIPALIGGAIGVLQGAKGWNKYTDLESPLGKILFSMLMISAFFSAPYYSFLFFLSIISACVLGNLLFKKDFFKENIRGDFPRLLFITFALLVLFASFPTGKENSMKIYLNQEYNYLPVERLEMNAKYLGIRAKYLGKLGDYAFLTSIDNNTNLIVRADYLSSLTFSHFPNKPASSQSAFKMTLNFITPKAISKHEEYK